MAVLLSDSRHPWTNSAGVEHATRGTICPVRGSEPVLAAPSSRGGGSVPCDDARISSRKLRWLCQPRHSSRSRSSLLPCRKASGQAGAHPVPFQEPTPVGWPHEFMVAARVRMPRAAEADVTQKPAGSLRRVCCQAPSAIARPNRQGRASDPADVPEQRGGRRQDALGCPFTDPRAKGRLRPPRRTFRRWEKSRAFHRMPAGCPAQGQSSCKVL